MTKNLYAIKDLKKGQYVVVQCFDTEQEFLRNTKLIADTDRQSLTYFFPQDYDCFQVAEIDVETGAILPNFKFIINVKSLKEKSNDGE